MAKITVIHQGNGDTEAHSAGCRDIARKLRTPEFLGTDDGGCILEGATTREIWLEYNMDYLEEGGVDSAWGIDFKPCCNLTVDNNRTYSKKINKI